MLDIAYFHVRGLRSHDALQEQDRVIPGLQLLDDTMYAFTISYEDMLSRVSIGKCGKQEFLHQCHHWRTESSRLGTLKYLI